MPATIPGSSPAPDVSAAVPTRHIQKVGRRTVDTSQDKDEWKKKALSFYDKIKVLDYMRAHHLTQKQTADYWQENGYQGRVSQKNISIWVKNEERIRGEVAKGGTKAATCRIREVKFPELEAALKLWVEGCEAKLQPITGPLIVAKAERLRAALNLPIDALKFSNGWVDEFKKRHALQHHQNHSEAGSVNLTSVKAEHEQMQHEL